MQGIMSLEAGLLLSNFMEAPAPGYTVAVQVQIFQAALTMNRHRTHKAMSTWGSLR